MFDLSILPISVCQLVSFVLSILILFIRMYVPFVSSGHFVSLSATTILLEDVFPQIGRGLSLEGEEDA